MRDVSLRVAPGEVVALLGPNGAGKTTTLSTVAGLRKPIAGERPFDGNPIGGRVGEGGAGGGLSVPRGMSCGWLCAGGGKRGAGGAG